MLLIDNGIEKMALKLQQRQNLSHIEFLKVRLGMQVVVINTFKAIVTYGLALLLNIFLYTLIVHLTFLTLRTYSHGAHAKTSMLCHVQNIVAFVMLPWLIVQYDISFQFLLILSLLSALIVIKYAPAATKKRPIAPKKVKGLKIKSIIVFVLLMTIACIVPPPYNRFVVYGVLLQSFTLLPIFSIKEEV
ncbi:accessory gene regulator AgrB [Staphylococcus intermedius]|uniref:Accessory gene regulator protein B n=2 Tax=Staphylococcus intermedius TaxID=1285 RepID=AGRB_STAIN|nr:accessory gene regulator AgrB [Staphylococcus intermedius]P61649.1 RecName: Full=Accessory gene regulator protein B [Staphylococcus intermedius]AAS66745.1 putative AIP processing/secretion protein [Staphylococcus intermedius]PCF63156.1 accessory gene regulator AgrB [Staphylococcus intermedius]PCF78048.1 accessory gene regulator AgrB [Staphylococcus intermedius]PCF79133.1 accessory gene regulator AgrB [Staphylococcus intermedius]PCF85451.1 accessory gene regulator AgrB [Staphylococcus inter